MFYAARPEFVTFTGVDDRTNLDDCASLGARYPIEWATLVGGRLGKNRYPLKKLDEIHLWDYSMKSVHLCGTMAAEAQRNKKVLDRLAEQFSRIQVNRRHEDYEFGYLRAWAFYELRTNVVVQWRRQTWPDDRKLFYLYDCSGGRGVKMSRPPVSDLDHLVGYAGGIGPDNVQEMLRIIQARYYWIDMESGVRTDDWLDLNKCEEVCRRIWS